MNSTVKRAFDLLRIIALEQGEYSLKSIVEKTGLNKTTLFRDLSTLEALNLVERRNNRYYLGLSLFELGNKVHIKHSLVDKLHPLLRQLSEEVNETVNLAQLFNNRLIYLDKIESRRSLQIQSAIGDTLPLHCTALGKSILSILPGESAKESLKNIRFKKFTKNTIQSLSQLKNQIEEIRDKGYSLDMEEFEEGLICIAMPLHFEKYNFYGSFSLSGPSIRFNGDNLKSLIEILRKYQSNFFRLIEPGR